MIEITERAKDALLDIRHSVEVADPDTALRLAPNASGQLELSMDVKKEGDQVIEHEGTPVLLIEGNVSQGLAGSTIDCAQTPQGAQLTLRRFPGSDGGPSLE